MKVNINFSLSDSASMKLYLFSLVAFSLLLGISIARGNTFLACLEAAVVAFDLYYLRYYYKKVIEKVERDGKL